MIHHYTNFLWDHARIFSPQDLAAILLAWASCLLPTNQITNQVTAARVLTPGMQQRLTERKRRHTEEWKAHKIATGYVQVSCNVSRELFWRHHVHQMATSTGLDHTSVLKPEVQGLWSLTFTQGNVHCKYCGVLLTYKRIDRRYDARTGPDGNYVHPSNHSIDATEANRPADTKYIAGNIEHRCTGCNLVKWFIPVEEFKLILRQLAEAARNLTFDIVNGYISNDEDDSGIALTEDDVDEIDSWVARNSGWHNGRYRDPAVIRACVMEVALGGGLYRDPSGAALPLKYASSDRIDSNGDYTADNIRVILFGLNGLKSNFKDDSSPPRCLPTSSGAQYRPHLAFSRWLPPRQHHPPSQRSTVTTKKTASLPPKTATITKTTSLPSPPNWRSSARSRRQSCQNVGDGTDSDASASSISDNDFEWRSSEAETTSDEKCEADDPTKTTRTKLPAIKESNRSKTASTHSSKTASQIQQAVPGPYFYEVRTRARLTTTPLTQPSSSSSPPKRKWGFSEDELIYVTADGVDLSAYIRLDHEPDWEELKQLAAKKRANQFQR